MDLFGDEKDLASGSVVGSGDHLKINQAQPDAFRIEIEIGRH